MRYRHAWTAFVLAGLFGGGSSAQAKDPWWKLWAVSAPEEVALDEQGSKDSAAEQTPDGTPVVPVATGKITSLDGMLNPTTLLNTAINAILPGSQNSAAPKPKATGAKSRSWRSKRVPARRR